MTNDNNVFLYICVLICCVVYINGDGVQRISRKKCQEYGNLISKNTCIESSANQGTAKAGDYPHMALIGYDTDGKIKWNCAGVLISEQYVLTVAHCLGPHHNMQPQVVRLGELNIQSEEDNTNIQDVQIAELIKHPEYKRPSYYHDIGLIKLEKPVELNQFVRPACLPKSDENIDIAEQRFSKSGWGLLPFANETRKPYLMYMKNTRTVSYEECNRIYKIAQRNLNKGINENNHICILQEPEMCQVTSGSPIQITDQDVSCMHKIIGIISFGKRPCDNSPEVSTKISPYLDWIESVVWA